MRTGDHALVLGGSIAGVTAARALADRYRRVTVVDRDRFPAVGAHRRGTPQERHIHALQTRGARAVERLFPGATEELAEAGAVVGEWGRDSTMCFAGTRLQQVDAGLELLAATRPLIEGHLRQRLAVLPNVRILEGYDVHGLTVDGSGSAVTGARVLRRQDGSTAERIPADLVVDATGRGSRLPHWLEDLGFRAPSTEETGLEVAYTTMRYPRLPEDDKHVIIVSARPPAGGRGGGAIAVEGDAWTVTLVGLQGEQAPTEEDGFVEFAASLMFPDIHDIVRDREPLSEPVLMRYPTSRRRRYEQLDRFPERLVVLGDALCSFNPVYGQGMSVAAVEALALGRCLDDSARRIGRRFLAAAQDVVDDAWTMASDADARYVTPEGGMSPPQRLVARYRLRLVEAAGHDPAVSRAFREVMAMTARPSSLVRPGVAARVLTSPWRRRRRRPAGEEAESPSVALLEG